MLFRQFLEPTSSTWTYLLADGGEAVLIDPVRDTVERDLQALADLGLRLAWSLETHVHADHVTAAGILRERTDCKTGVCVHAGISCVDVQLQDGQDVLFGGARLRVIETPGHTACSLSFYSPELAALFTGDALLIRGCGRTDFQNGDATTLYRMVHQRLFVFPDPTLVYPGHDYQGRTVSTIGEERRLNPRLSQDEANFVALMGALNLPRPKLIDVAVPANLRCGVSEV